MSQNEVLEDALVVAHATGGMVVDADGKRIAVEPNVVAGQRASGLEGKPHKGARPTDGMHPFDGGAEDGLNVTTNLEGEPEGGKEVSLCCNARERYSVITFLEGERK